MKHLLLFSLASALGALSRYGLTMLASLLCRGAFPWGTFIVNIIGCLLFGLVWGMAESARLFADATRVILLTGFMGSFTTFSAFIFDSHMLLENRAWLAFMSNIFFQIFLGLVALNAGIKCAHLMARMAH